MNWSYIAGYFDGEGHVSMHGTKRKNLTHALLWHNTHRESLEAMRDFMDAGHIHSKKQAAHQNKPGYILSVVRRADLLRILENLIPRLIIKRKEAEALRDYVSSSIKDLSLNFGKVAAVSSEQLLAWYHDEGLSYSQIATRLGVKPTSVAQAFHRRGLKARPRGCNNTKGVPKSEETRRRMRESRRRMWDDPAFRDRQAKLREARRSGQSVTVNSFTLTAGNG